MLLGCPAFKDSGAKHATSFGRKRSWADTFNGNYGSWSGCDDSEIEWPSLDGIAEDESRGNYRPRRASAGTAEQPTPTERTLALPAVFTRPRPISVADRVRAINNPSHVTQERPTTSPTDNKYERAVTKRQSSNLAKRMGPFVSHDGSNQSPEIHSPLIQSKEPLKPTKIHSPVPQRQSVSLLKDVTDLPTSRNLFQSRSMHSLREKAAPQELSVAEKTNMSSNADTMPRPSRMTCSRHGRQLKTKKRPGPTIEGMEKSLSGAYIPSGRKIRHQVEQTSPWYVLAKTLTKTEGTSLSPEPCPDCVAEEAIRRREDAETQESASISAVPEASSSADEISSTKTEAGTPVEEGSAGPTMIGTAADYQTVLLPGTAIPEMVEAGESSLVVADLGEMIDAIIIEHRGTLNRVITNLRDRAPDAGRFQRISRELSTVSETLGKTRPKHADVSEPGKARYSVVLDSPPEFIRSRTKSVPDLLEYIDAAAKDLGLRLSPAAGTGGSHGPETNESTERAAEMPLIKAGIMLRDRAANKSITPTGPGDSTPDQSVVKATGKVPDSPLLIAVNVPESMPASMPVPMIGPHGTIDEDYTTPQAGVKMSAERLGGLHEAISPDGSSESRSLASKIPEPLGPMHSGGSNRKHVSGQALWGTPGKPSSKNPLQSLKPSEVRELRHQQGTFAQPFVKELARDASLKERSQRRARVSHEVPGSLV